MKKKLSALLIGSLLAISLVGCSNSGISNTESSDDISAQNSVQASENTGNNLSSDMENSDISKSESTAQSEKSEIIGPEDGDIVLNEDGSEIILNEDESISGTNIDEDSMPVTSDGKEELPKYLDVTFTPININDKNIDINSIDMSKPVYYTISSTDELKNFVSQYDKTYSLNDVENGITFNSLTEEFDDAYFEYMTLIVIPAKYDKDTETEIGEITVSDSNYNIQICTQPPASADRTNCICFVVQANKYELGNNNIVLDVVEENILLDNEEDI